MPEVHLTLQWPDGRVTSLYSPSTAILQHLPPGTSLPVARLREQARKGFRQASERVRARYGFACSRADEEERKLLDTADGYAADALVTIVTA